jgi:Carboxypeptidase regulatory-like domain
MLKGIMRCRALRQPMQPCSSVWSPRHRCWVSVAAFVVFGAIPASGQDSTGTIEGIVRDTAGGPVAGAQVVAGGGGGVNTDSLGRYRFDSLPAGRIALLVRRVGYRVPAYESVTVARGGVTQANLVLVPISHRRVVFIPCPAGTTAPDGGTCVSAREIRFTELAPMGVGLIQDRETWDGIVRRFHLQTPTGVGNVVVDWTHEMLVFVSYGRGLAEMDEGWGFNRAETRDSSLIIVLGPDSIVGKREMFIDGILFPRAYAIPRMSRPVRYEMRVSEGWLPPRVDWRSLVDTTAHAQPNE